MASIQKRPNGSWRARYRDAAGKEHARHFARKIDAQRWLDEVTTSVLTGRYIDPKSARTTVGEWADAWLVGYSSKRPSTVRQAKIHLKRIKAQFGARPLSSVRPSDVKAWTVALKDEGLADSTVYALHKRLGQLFADAVHDDLVPKSPVSRRTSPGAGEQRPYVATTGQIWGLYDAMPAHARPGVLLGAFAGLRVAEAVALRVGDVDFMRGVITPAVQYPAEPLKTKASKDPVPIPGDLAVMLNRNVSELGSGTIVASAWGRMMSVTAFERLFREARDKVADLPEGFRFHDLRHYFASLLISQGLDVKVVQKCMRHGSATTTLDVYGHMFPDKDESARAAVQTVLAARADCARTGTDPVSP